jgi:hypothetical protein
MADRERIEELEALVQDCGMDMLDHNSDKVRIKELEAEAASRAAERMADRERIKDLEAEAASRGRDMGQKRKWSDMDEE